MDDPKTRWKKEQSKLRLQKRKERKEIEEKEKIKFASSVKEVGCADETIKIDHPKFEFLAFFPSAIVSFFGYGAFSQYLEDILFSYIQIGIIEVFVKTGILMIYVIPLIICGLLFKSKWAILRIIGIFFGGLAFGPVIWITIGMVRLISPYKF